jgi:hypothetical protein
MSPTWFQVEYRGRFSTFRTCAGPVGAFHQSTGERPQEWQYLNDKETVVNGCLVTKVDLNM